jgi:hypothetical protein
MVSDNQTGHGARLRINHTKPMAIHVAPRPKMLMEPSLISVNNLRAQQVACWQRMRAELHKPT